jgi:trehalose-phosphatase
LTVHYRNVKQPDRIEKLRTDVARAIEPFSRELQLLDAAMAIEIAPDLGWTKGTALRMILAHIGDRAVLPLYAGDEANDADALMTAAQLGGVAIGVGQVAPSTAHYRLADPLAFSRCVDSLLNMLVATSVPACHP